MYTTFFEPANTLPPGVTPCLAMFVALLRSATGCNSGVTFFILLALHRFLGSGISRASLGAIMDHFSFNFTPSYSGWRSWGDLFANSLPPPPFFTVTRQDIVGSHHIRIDFASRFPPRHFEASRLISAISNPKGGNRAPSIRIRAQ